MHDQPHLSARSDFKRVGERLKGILFDSGFFTLTATATTVTDGDNRSFEPLLAAIKAAGDYNEFAGPKVEKWLRKQLFVNGGPVVTVTFGLSYSPLLVLELARCDRTLTKLDRVGRRRQQSEVKKAAQELNPDSIRLAGLGTVRIWWD